MRRGWLALLLLCLSVSLCLAEELRLERTSRFYGLTDYTSSEAEAIASGPVWIVRGDFHTTSAYLVVPKSLRPDFYGEASQIAQRLGGTGLLLESPRHWTLKVDLGPPSKSPEGEVVKRINPGALLAASGSLNPGFSLTSLSQQVVQATLEPQNDVAPEMRSRILVSPSSANLQSPSGQILGPVSVALLLGFLGLMQWAALRWGAWSLSVISGCLWSTPMHILGTYSSPSYTMLWDRTPWLTWANLAYLTSLSASLIFFYQRFPDVGRKRLRSAFVGFGFSLGLLSWYLSNFNGILVPVAMQLGVLVAAILVAFGCLLDQFCIFHRAKSRKAPSNLSVATANE